MLRNFRPRPQDRHFTARDIDGALCSTRRASASARASAPGQTTAGHSHRSVTTAGGPPCRSPSTGATRTEAFSGRDPRFCLVTAPPLLVATLVRLDVASLGCAHARNAPTRLGFGARRACVQGCSEISLAARGAHRRASPDAHALTRRSLLPRHGTRQLWPRYIRGKRFL